jgi:phosphoglycolate phosphatase-like HAD superfamily hydrolase
MMDTTYINRRLKQVQFRHVQHALDLLRSHGWRYAVVYLRNHRIAESTLQRVLFGEWQRHRVSANKLIIRQS